MESRVKVLGHATHPIPAALPIGLLDSALGFDLLGLITGQKQWRRAAFWNMAAGCASGWASMPPGAIDWWFLPRGTRAKRCRWLGSRDHWRYGDQPVRRQLATTPSRPRERPQRRRCWRCWAALALGAVGWFGGELVQRMGVSVSPDASLDAR